MLNKTNIVIRDIKGRTIVAVYPTTLYSCDLSDKQYTKKWNKWWETGDWDDEENE